MTAITNKLVRAFYEEDNVLRRNVRLVIALNGHSFGKWSGLVLLSLVNRQNAFVLQPHKRTLIAGEGSWHDQSPV